MCPYSGPLKTNQALPIEPEVPDFIGAEGRNRTADTGIFSPQKMNIIQFHLPSQNDYKHIDNTV